MAKDEKKTMGVKLSGSWYYTRAELATKYDASASFIWKKIQDNKVEEQVVLGYKVYKDDPAIFTKKIPGKISAENLPRTGTYPEMYQKVDRIEAGNKDIFDVVSDIYERIETMDKDVAAVKELLLQLIDVNTKPSGPSGPQGGLFSPEAKR